MFFGKIVSKVASARCPVNVELALFDAVSDPIEAHVHGFGADLFHFVVDDAKSGGVVGLGWGWRLGMSHFSKGCAKRGTASLVL